MLKNNYLNNNKLLIIYIQIIFFYKYFEIYNFLYIFDENYYIRLLIILSYFLVLYLNLYRFKILSLLLIRFFIFIFDSYYGLYGLISAFSLILIDIAIFEEFFYRYKKSTDNYLKVYFYIIVFINILLINLVSGVAHIIDGTWLETNALKDILLNGFYSRFVDKMFLLSINYKLEFEFLTKNIGYLHIIWSIFSLILIFLNHFIKKLIIVYAFIFFSASGFLLEISYLPFFTIAVIFITGLNIWNIPIADYSKSFFKFIINIKSIKYNQINFFIFSYMILIFISWTAALLFVVITPIKSNYNLDKIQLNSYINNKNNVNTSWLLFPGNFMGSLLANVFNRYDIGAYQYLNKIYRVDVNGNYTQILIFDEKGRHLPLLSNNFYLYNVALPLGRCFSINDSNCIDEINKFILIDKKYSNCNSCTYLFERYEK